jgi:tRNA(Ile2) C34 agmatinyltransferase TiaS
MISEAFVIGVDDTDTAEAGGTGGLVRALGAQARTDGFGEPEGVTRHALWRSDKVAATERNHCYALVLRSERSVLDLEDYVVDFVRDAAEPAADPGIAIMSRHSDMPHVLAFGRRSQQELMRLDWAQTFSTESNVSLRALGRERRGSIGALAAAGLRAGGGDGYFIDLDGLRELEGRVTAGQIRERTVIEHVLDEAGEELDRDDVVETFDWVRPHLEEGQPVLHATRSTEDRKVWLLDHRRPAGADADD